MFPTCLQPWAKPCLSNVPLYVALTKSLQAELFGSCHNWLNRPGASKMSKAAQLRKARDLESRVSNEIKDPMQYFVDICQSAVLHFDLFSRSFFLFFLNFGPQILSQACGNSWKALSKQEFFQVLKKDNLSLSAVALWHGFLIHIFKAIRFVDVDLCYLKRPLKRPLKPFIWNCQHKQPSLLTSYHLKSSNIQGLRP